MGRFKDWWRSRFDRRLERTDNPRRIERLERRRDRQGRIMDNVRADRLMGPTMGKWAQGGPITVYYPHRYHAHALTPLQLARLRDAVDWWHHQIGRDVFYPSPASDAEMWAHERDGYVRPRSCMVLQAPPLRPEATATIEAVPDQRTGHLHHANVRMLPETTYRGVQHELGHALGLGHVVASDVQTYRQVATGAYPHAELVGAHRPGDPRLLMSLGGTGDDLLPEEMEWLGRQWPTVSW